MINFRYHVVSLTAVFLALAVGMVLGTAALNGPVTEDLYSEAQSLRKSNGQLRDQISAMEDELAGREEYIKEAAPLLLDGKLTGRKVVLFAMPGADQRAVDAVADNVRLTGATLTGRVRLTSQFTDPARKEDARDLATRLLPPNVENVPSDADGVTASTALLGAVLMAHTPVVTVEDRTAVLAGYQAEALIAPDKRITQPADGMIIVTDLPVTAQYASERNAAVMAAVKQFSRVGPVVLAAPATGGDGNPVAAVRADAVERRSLSTVDNVNTSLGQLSAVLALVQRIVDHRTGHYGIHDGATGRIPKPTT